MPHSSASLARLLLLAGLLVGLPALAGCAGCERHADGLRGEVRIDGSSTVYPLTEAVAEEFMRDHPGARVTVGVSGTGGGFARFVRGETDISNASRAISGEEAAQAAAAGIRFVELPVAYDGIAIAAHRGVDWVDCLTTAELRRIWAPGSAIRSWRDVRAAFPDVPLRLYGPGTDSGTYDYFTRAIVGEEGASRTDFTASEDDNVLVQGIAGEAGAMGFFGLLYYEENADRLTLIAVDAGSGCVRPTRESVQSGAYAPLARPEFIYVNADRAGTPLVDSLVAYYLRYAGTLAPEVGAVPLAPGTYARVADRYRAGRTGSLFAEGSAGRASLDERLATAAEGIR